MIHCIKNLVCEDVDCWLSRIPMTSCSSEANCIIYSQGTLALISHKRHDIPLYTDYDVSSTIESYKSVYWLIKLFLAP